MLLRVENPASGQGLWYTEDGRFDPLITRLENFRAASYPMQPDARFRLDGDRWFSACDNVADMSNWFSPEDLKVLDSLGFSLFGFEVTKYRTLNGHAVFRREDVVSTVLLPFHHLLLPLAPDAATIGPQLEKPACA